MVGKQQKEEAKERKTERKKQSRIAKVVYIFQSQIIVSKATQIRIN